LLSDSRWTYPSTRVEDQGAKLFQIAEDAGAVYSGDVRSGDLGLNQLAGSFKIGKVKTSRSKTARDLLRNAYSRHAPDGPLRVFIGVCGPTTPARLLYFDSDQQFNPKRLSSVNVMAAPEAESAFREGLSEVTAETITTPSDLTVHRAALTLIIALQNYVIEPAFDSSIGGNIQCSIIDNTGFRRMGYCSIKRGINYTNLRKLRRVETFPKKRKTLLITTAAR